jgi:hypothetical protein
MTNDPFERAARAERTVELARTGVRIHIGVYVAVNLMLFIIWAFTPHPSHTVPWFLYSVMGWGIGVVAHYIAVRGWIRAGGPKPGEWNDRDY